MTSATRLQIPAVDIDANNLGAAMDYAAAGFYVLPVRDGTKDAGSVVGKRWQDKSSRDPQQIAAWFAGSDHGIALHVGRSGAVVFDVDHSDKLPAVLAEHLDAAPYQSTRPETPARGHYVFAQPPGRTIGNSVGRLGGGWGEVRGLNGVIIAANTRHPDGGEYRWLRVGVVRVLPGELAELLDDATPASDAASDAAVAAFIAEHTTVSRPELLLGRVAQFSAKVAAGTSRHHSMVPIVTGALEEARTGFYPAADAVAELGAAFRAAVTGDGSRSDAQARAEWANLIAWGVGQANAANLTQVRAGVAEPMPRDDTEGLLQLVAPRLRDAMRAAPIDGNLAQVVELKSRRTSVEQAAALAETRNTFRRWLGDGYDLDALHFTLAVAAVERLAGDPLWGLLVSGSGNAKTETAQAVSKLDRTLAVSTITSVGALLSGTSRKERDADSTGGLLCVIGERGVLAIKDVTSILSMGRELRAEVLAALREVYDGYWTRTVGTDGGRTLSWRGRIAVIGAVTTAWDTAHSVVAAMGDRFVLLRMDSTQGRIAAGLRAIDNTGSESAMRDELATAVADVVGGVDSDGAIELTGAERDRLMAAADIVCLGRTAVEFDYRSNPEYAHAPEMPTRFAKQLAQVLRGAVAVGMCRGEALRLAIRCARDSMPPLRLAIVDYLAEHPMSSTAEVRKGIKLPRNTVDRQLQALHMLGLLSCHEEEIGVERYRWRYLLADGVDPSALVFQKCQ